MVRFISLSAAAILAASVATSALAQPVVSEPGMEAFVHPNSDLGIGTMRPVADANTVMSVNAGARAPHIRMRATRHR